MDKAIILDNLSVVRIVNALDFNCELMRCTEKNRIGVVKTWADTIMSYKWGSLIAMKCKHSGVWKLLPDEKCILWLMWSVYLVCYKSMINTILSHQFFVSSLFHYHTIRNSSDDVRSLNSWQSMCDHNCCPTFARLWNIVIGLSDLRKTGECWNETSDLDFYYKKLTAKRWVKSVFDVLSHFCLFQYKLVNVLWVQIIRQVIANYISNHM